MTEHEALQIPSDRDASGRSFDDRELGYLREVLASGALNSNGGSMVARFEKAFARALRVEHAIACSSGSLAVQAALAACDLAPGSEVVTSPVTDFGAITAILYEGLQPRFCDVDPETLMPSVETVEAACTSRTTAVIATHLFGRALPAERLRDACASRDLMLIEDAAQTLGTTRKDRRPGGFGHLGAFSFQQSKQMSSGEGGAIVTNDAALARRARLFVNKAWPYGEPDPDHLFIAPNGRLTELQAAVLLAQLEKLPAFVRARVESAHALLDGLRAGLAGGAESLLRFPKVDDGDLHSYWRLHLRSAPELDVDALVERAREHGIPCQAHYVGRAAFELRAMRDRGFQERAVDYPGVVDGLAHCLVLPWNEKITPRLATEMGSRLASIARECAR